MTKISNQYSLTNILTADLANSRLGINNVSPTVALDVTGAGKFSSSVTAITPSALFKEGYIIQGTTTSGPGSQPAYTYYTAAGSKRWSHFLDVGSDKFNIANASNSEVFTITQTGLVGIGTITPSGYALSLAAIGSNSGLNVVVGVATLVANFNNTSNNPTNVRWNNFNGNFYDIATNPSDNSFTIDYNDNERLRIASSGNLLLGITTDNAKLTIDAGAASSSKPTIWMNQGAGAGGYAYLAGTDSFHSIVFRGVPSVSGDYSVNATDVMSFAEFGGEFRFYQKQPGVLSNQIKFVTGTIYATNTSVQSISDIRTKENIVNSKDGLDIIIALRPVRFDFKDGFNESKKNQLGFIAQEVEKIFPDAMGEWKNDNDGINYKTVGPAALIPVLVKAIQELSAKVSLLENK